MHCGRKLTGKWCEAARVAVGEMQADVARTYAVDPPTICRLQQGASHE